MSIDRFSVKILFGWRHFDRTLPHTFSVIEHEKLRIQQGELELQKLKGLSAVKIGKKVQFYSECAHIVFDYSGQHHVILTAYGQKDAKKIARRLMLCDGELDKWIALNPSDQWKDEQGDIK